MIVLFLVAVNSIQNASDHALRVAVEASKQAEINRVFVKEKVCSDTNQGEPCRDLFERLANNLSKEQRFRLACLVLYETKEYQRHAELGCPPPRMP